LSSPHPGESRSEIEDVCLLVGDERVPKWFGTAVERMVVETDVTVRSVVVTDGENDDGGQAGSGLASRLLGRVQTALTDTGSETDVTALSCVSSSEVRHCPVEGGTGPSVEIPDDEVDRIAAESDVVVQNGVGILKGRILTAPDHGVLSYHHGDVREYRGQGYGFWEYLHGEPRGGVTLQRLNEELDAGESIAVTAVDIRDAYTYKEVQRRLDRASEPLLSQGIRRLQEPTFTPEAPSEAELGTLYYSSDVTPRVKARYLGTELVNRIRRRIRWPTTPANEVVDGH